MNRISTNVKGRVTLLLTGAALIGIAVLVRVWLAASGGYSEGSLSIFLRVGSGLALASGFLLAGVAVAWPMRRPKGHGKPPSSDSS